MKAKQVKGFRHTILILGEWAIFLSFFLMWKTEWLSNLCRSPELSLPRDGRFPTKLDSRLIHRFCVLGSAHPLGHWSVCLVRGRVRWQQPQTQDPDTGPPSSHGHGQVAGILSFSLHICEMGRVVVALLWHCEMYVKLRMEAEEMVISLSSSSFSPHPSLCSFLPFSEWLFPRICMCYGEKWDYLKICSNRTVCLFRPVSEAPEELMSNAGFGNPWSTCTIRNTCPMAGPGIPHFNKHQACQTLLITYKWPLPFFVMTKSCFVQVSTSPWQKLGKSWLVYRDHEALSPPASDAVLWAHLRGVSGTTALFFENLLSSSASCCRVLQPRD